MYYSILICVCMYNGHSVTLLVSKKNEENLRKRLLFSNLEIRLIIAPLLSTMNFALLDCPPQDASCDV
jgi:hypothetical protein